MTYIPSAHYKVARILVKPTAAWMTVWPTPHIMAWVGTMLKLLCLYTKATAAEERTPAHKNIFVELRFKVLMITYGTTQFT